MVGMNVILFGATGMVGQGVLRECLLDPDVRNVLSIGRTATGEQNSKFRELVRSDLFDYSAIEDQLSGFDACFFCLGVSSVGMAEDKYRHITYDLTMAAARCLAKLNPNMTFIYVSGMNTDSSGRGWARVKGETENALLQLSFKAAYMFRPGAIVPQHCVRSKTQVYQIFYTLTGPLLPLLHRWFPKFVTTTDQLGRAMLKVARSGWPKPVLENADINAV